MIKRRIRPLTAAAALALLATAPGWAQNVSFNASIAGGFAPSGVYASLSASGTSTNVALPAGTTVVVYNPGTVAAYVKIGASSAVTATTADDVVQPGGSLPLVVGSNTYLAAITASGSTMLNLSGGSGLATATGGLGSGSGGSGFSTTDEASFTGGSSLFAGSGGFYQATPTNNALTSGQQGMFQLTANRALFTNLRNSSGTELGTATTPLQVSLANTGSNGTAVVVNGSNVTQPVSAASLPLPSGAATAANQTSVQGTVGVGAAPADMVVSGALYNSTAPSLANGQSVALQADSAGRLIVDCASGCGGSGGTSLADEGGFTQGTTSFTPIGGVYNTSITNLTAGQAGAAQLTADRMLFTNLGKIGGTAVVNGGTAGSLAVGGLGTAGTPSGGIVSVQGVSGGTPLPISAAALPLPSGAATAANQTSTHGTIGAGTAPANTVVGGAVYNSTAPSASSGQSLALQADSSGNLMVDIAKGGTVAQGSTTSGEGGSLVMGAVTTSPPSYTTAMTDPLSLDTSGNLRVTNTTGCAGQPMSSTSFTNINLTASGQLLTGSSGKQIYVCEIHVIAGAADNVALVEGTGTTCGTSTAGMMGGSTAATGWTLAANGGLVAGNGQGVIAKTATAADNVCLLVSGSAQVSGNIVAAQF